ncbi:serine hydrolase domain-containing protein [Nonomuraea sp. NPDC000554]|uniref:serine hydrolase domain-containing protein n=1 Tax=Nonomuraea sp. NPDC000554 TaxID=3154259 RepID=UPI00332A183B
MSLDEGHWRDRLAHLTAEHGVPGAALAVHHRGGQVSVAAGVLNLDTEVNATGDSVFQLGSVGKAYTAALVVRLFEQGLLDLDAPVLSYLPGFRVADAEVTKTVTLRHLLSHTSGIDGDHFLDTGRADDALERYVESCAALRQAHPLGAVMSYCNSGYAIAGRVVERVTGDAFDVAVRRHLLDPLGVERTVSLPEEVLRHRAAYGHVPGPDGAATLAPRWEHRRSMAPAGGLAASAPDVVAFARMLAADGVSPLSGERILTAEGARLMRTPQVAVPDTSLAEHWGLGLMLAGWDGLAVAGHDGSTVGQGAMMRFAPDADLAVALVANGGDFGRVGDALFAELFSALAGITVPAGPAPSGGALPAGAQQWIGRYDSVNVSMTVEPGDEHELALTLTLGSLAAEHLGGTTFTGPLSHSAGDVYVARHLGAGDWQAVVFLELADGSRYLHCNGRALRRIES